MASDNSSSMVLQLQTTKDQLNVMVNIIPVVTELSQAYDLRQHKEMEKKKTAMVDNHNALCQSQL